MAELSSLQLALIFVIFVWSGFVRSGLGFGGAVLALPFLLLVHNQPLVFLPVIAVQLVVFSATTVLGDLLRHYHSGVLATVDGETRRVSPVNWRALRAALAVMLIPKLIGVFGLITLPPVLMSGIIFGIIFVYAVSYLLDRPFVSNSRRLDFLFLVAGGYVSGTSLVGAPLIVAVLARRMPAAQLRDTLFVLWFILVAIKLGAFVYAGVSLQWQAQLWLFPAAFMGHLLGLYFHRYTLRRDTRMFFRVLGAALLVCSAAGLYQSLAG